MKDWTFYIVIPIFFLVWERNARKYLPKRRRKAEKGLGEMGFLASKDSTKPPGAQHPGMFSFFSHLKTKFIKNALFAAC